MYAIISSILIFFTLNLYHEPQYEKNISKIQKNVQINNEEISDDNKPSEESALLQKEKKSYKSIADNKVINDIEEIIILPAAQDNTINNSDNIKNDKKQKIFVNCYL